MRPLDQLGFVRRAAESAKALNSFLQHTSLSIPESYIQSLGFMPPNGRMFGFKFRREKGGEEWEGQVERFYDYGSQPTLLENSILRPGRSPAPSHCNRCRRERTLSRPALTRPAGH